MNIDEFLQLATANITASYFKLPIYGREDPIYRERLYCYELYHQLRLLWSEDSEFHLHGEVDKSGHPAMRNTAVASTKPDFIIHTPGEMEHNLCVIEVKPVNAPRLGIMKDLFTLSAFQAHASYKRAINLLYGRCSRRVLEARLQGIVRDVEGKLDVSSIEFWLHEEVGQQAERII